MDPNSEQVINFFSWMEYENIIPAFLFYFLIVVIQKKELMAIEYKE